MGSNLSLSSAIHNWWHCVYHQLFTTDDTVSIISYSQLMTLRLSSAIHKWWHCGCSWLVSSAICQPYFNNFTKWFPPPYLWPWFHQSCRIMSSLHARARARTRARTHARTHAHTHTHTHRQSDNLSSMKFSHSRMKGFSVKSNNENRLANSGEVVQKHFLAT